MANLVLIGVLLTSGLEVYAAPGGVESVDMFIADEFGGGSSWAIQSPHADRYRDGRIVTLTMGGSRFDVVLERPMEDTAEALELREVMAHQVKARMRTWKHVPIVLRDKRGGFVTLAGEEVLAAVVPVTRARAGKGGATSAGAASE